jgi:hypothetical protein
MKLSEKFARQETEAARLMRIGRRRLSRDRIASVRQFLGVEPEPRDEPAPAASGPHVCQTCGRAFALPMHLGRHRKSKHEGSSAA